MVDRRQDRERPGRGDRVPGLGSAAAGGRTAGAGRRREDGEGEERGEADAADDAYPCRFPRGRPTGFGGAAALPPRPKC